MFWRRKNKNQEEFYKEFFEKEASIINYLADGILFFDKYNRLFLINPKAEELLAVKKEEVLEKPFLRLSHFPNFSPLFSFLGGEMKKVFREELKIKEEFILEVTTIPITMGEEKTGTIIVLHDVSREKLVEKVKTEFVTYSAHRLRTPTSIIKWTLEMLLKGDFGELNQKQKEVLEKANITNNRMIELVSALLDVAKIEEGRYLSKMVLSSIEDVIQLVIDIHIERIKKKKLHLEFQKPEGEIPQIMLDSDKMTTAIENILDNSIRYSFPGGKITISLIAGGKEIEVQIKDTGVGIPGSQQEKVFTKFFRGSNILRIETEGTGLGLFISKNIIEAHGGRIWFDSKEGKGTTFYFTLPVKKGFGEFLTEEFY